MTSLVQGNITLFIARFSVLVLSFVCSALMAATPVSTYRIQETTFSSSVELNATLSVIDEVNVSAEVSGRVADVFAEAGDKVRSNKKILKINDSDQMLELAQAKATLAGLEAENELARLELKRISTLAKNNTVSQNEYDRAAATAKNAASNVTAQKSVVDLATSRLSKHLVLSPFDGLLSNRHAGPGDWLNVGDPVATITMINPLRLIANVPQQYFLPFNEALKNGSLTVKLNNTSYAATQKSGSESITLNVERIVARADASRQFEAWATIDNSLEGWLAGASVTALFEWPVPMNTHQVVVPVDALNQQTDGSFILWEVVTDAANGEEHTSIVKAVPVSVIERRDGKVLVRIHRDASLAASDVVVITGNESLRPDQPVTISDDQ